MIQHCVRGSDASKKNSGICFNYESGNDYVIVSINDVLTDAYGNQSAKIKLDALQIILENIQNSIKDDEIENESLHTN